MWLLLALEDVALVKLCNGSTGIDRSKPSLLQVIYLIGNAVVRTAMSGT